ncbi:MAG: hypothetical protein ABW219_06755 [Ilumatobacteraceae bacterium]
MDWVASLPGWLLLVGWLAIALLTAVVGRLVVRAIVPEDERGDILGVVAPLMPALGATFAVLTAITLSSEAGYLKSAQDLVSAEAASASRLAWSATSPGVDSAPVHAALLGYLQATVADEWSGDRAARGDDTATLDAIATLERVVRTEAARTELGTPVSTELLASVDAMTTGRRARIAAASRDLPALYVVTLVASGIALILNAGALVARVGRRAALLVVGLAVVVGLSLALLFSISGPWRGPLVVPTQPMTDVIDDLQRGFFSS